MSSSEPPKKTDPATSSAKDEDSEPRAVLQDGPVKTGATDAKNKKQKNLNKESGKASGAETTQAAPKKDIHKKTEPSAPKQGVRIPGGVFGLFILLLLAGGIGGFSVRYLEPYLGLSDTNDTASVQNRLSTLETRLSTLNREISQTQENVDALGSPDANADAAQVQTIADALGSLETRVSGLEQGLAQIVQLPQNEVEPKATPSLITGSQPNDSLLALETSLTALRADLTNTQDLFNSKVTTLEERTAPEILEQKLADTLAGTLASTATKDDLKPIDTRLAALESNAPPPDLNRLLAGAASKTELRPLEERLAALEAVRTDKAARQAAIALALANLMRAADSGKPFNTELIALVSLSPETKALATLKSAAKTGVTRQDILAAQFDALGTQLFDAERFAGADTWWTRLLANLKGLIIVRRTGNLEGNSVEAIIARTEMHLKDGDLRTATQEMQALQGAPAQAAAAWLSQATMRATLTDISEQLSTQILDNLGKTES